MRRKNLYITSVIFLSAFHIFGQGYIQENMPQRIILNITEDPTTSIAVTWRTNDFVEDAQVEIAPALDWIDFIDAAMHSNAVTEQVELDTGEKVFQHSTVVNQLTPNTFYVYRVGSDTVWSEWNQFKTANNQTAPFEFVYFGDVQHDVAELCSRLFRKAYSSAPNAAFWLSTGDLVDRPQYDWQLGEFFEAASFIPRVMPMVLTAGNHEYRKWNEDETKYETLAELWKCQVTQPASKIDELDETVFYFDYQGVRFIILNGTQKLNEQTEWLRNVLADNQNMWTIVSVHQPIFSMGKNRNQRKTQDAFMPLFAEFNVDLVLQGHDHVYARSYKLKNGIIVPDSEKGTVFVTSNLGSDSYSVISPNEKLAAKLGNKVQLFQVVSIDNNELIFQAVTVTGQIYDSFVLKK